MPLNTEKILFVLVAVLMIVLFLAFFSLPLIKHILFKKNPIRWYYYKIKKIADYNDYLLINEFSSTSN